MSLRLRVSAFIHNKSLKNKKTYKQLALLAAISCLFLFLQTIDVGEVKNQLVQIGWQFSLVFLITGIAYAMASTAWLLCFKEIPAQLSASKLFVYRQIGETLTTINPANIVVGQSAKVYLLKQDGVTYEEGIVSILLSRILIFLSMIALFLLLPFALYKMGWVGNITWMGIGGLFLFISLMVVVFYAMIHPTLLLHQWTLGLSQKWNLPFLKKLLPKIQSVNQLLCDFYQTHQLKLFLAFVLSVFHWLMGALEIYVLLYFLDIKITVLAAILVEVGITCIKSMGAFIPGQVGVEEYGNKLMLGLVGVSSGSIWVTISILRRTRQVIWLLIGGLFFLLVYRKF